MKFAITGSSGYVGSIIKKYVSERGHEVFELRRKTNGVSDHQHVVPFSLEKLIPPDFFNGIDALIHCAYDFQPRLWKKIYDVNVLASIKLFQAAKNAGVRHLIFISSLSAYDECKSNYGKAKLLTEKALLPLGVICVRPGLVFGCNAGGMVGALKKIIQHFNVIPVIDHGSQPLYMAHEQDLAAAIYELSLKDEKINTPLPLCNSTMVTFRSVLNSLASIENKRLFYLSFPLTLTLFLLRCVETLGIAMRLKSDSLLGLLYPNRQINWNCLNSYSFSFRPFNTTTAYQ